MQEKFFSQNRPSADIYRFIWEYFTQMSYCKNHDCDNRRYIYFLINYIYIVISWIHMFLSWQSYYSHVSYLFHVEYRWKNLITHWCYKNFYEKNFLLIDLHKIYTYISKRRYIVARWPAKNVKFSRPSQIVAGNSQVVLENLIRQPFRLELQKLVAVRNKRSEGRYHVTSSRSFSVHRSVQNGATGQLDLRYVRATITVVPNDRMHSRISNLFPPPLPRPCSHPNERKCATHTCSCTYAVFAWWL